MDVSYLLKINVSSVAIGELVSVASISFKTLVFTLLDVALAIVLTVVWAALIDLKVNMCVYLKLCF